MLRPAASLFTGTGTGRSSALSSRSTAPNRSGGLWQTPSPRPRWKYDSVPAKKTWSRLNFSNAAWNRYSGTAAQPGAFAATRKVKQNWPESRWRNTSCSRKRHPGRLGRCVPRLRPFCHRPCGTPAWAGEPGRVGGSQEGLPHHAEPRPTEHRRGPRRGLYLEIPLAAVGANGLYRQTWCQCKAHCRQAARRPSFPCSMTSCRRGSMP